jgi:hypothetical protein
VVSKMAREAFVAEMAPPSCAAALTQSDLCCVISARVYEPRIAAWLHYARCLEPLTEA